MTNTMDYMNYQATISWDSRDEIWVGRVQNMKDAITFHGTSEDEIERAFRDAVDSYLSFCARKRRQPAQQSSEGIDLNGKPKAILHRNRHGRRASVKHSKPTARSRPQAKAALQPAPAGSSRAKRV